MINGFLMKLNQVLEGSIPATVGESWIRDGFVVIFTGLLSVTGKERTMIEDSDVAIDSLRKFKISIRRGGPTCEMVDIDMEKRVVIMYVPEVALAKLPPSFTGPNVEIRLVTVLFTQGIDMNQTIAIQTEGKSSDSKLNSSDLQKSINDRSLEVVL